MNHKTPQQLANMDKSALIKFGVEVQTENVKLRYELERRDKRSSEVIRKLVLRNQHDNRAH